VYELQANIYSYFALVNSYSNASGDLVSERLVPELENDFDLDSIPAPPTGPLPEAFVPSDDGLAVYQAYRPKDADAGLDYIPQRDKVAVQIQRVDERKKQETTKRYDRMGGTQRPKNSYLDGSSKTQIKAKGKGKSKGKAKKRKLDEYISTDEDFSGGEVEESEDEAAPPSHKKAKGKENVKPAKRS
jgi:hypothetical protein